VLGATAPGEQYYLWAAAARALQLRGRRPRPTRPSGALRSHRSAPLTRFDDRPEGLARAGPSTSSPARGAPPGGSRDGVPSTR